jgi:kynureninase
VVREVIPWGDRGFIDEELVMRLPKSRAECEQWDLRDPLAAYRREFRLRPGLVYLDGNSLGALTNRSAERVRAMVEDEWGRDLISSWNVHGWFDLPSRLGAAIAPLIGASADEVLVADSTSINLFKLAAAAAMARGTRCRIVTESGNFPTDLYVLQGLAQLADGGIEIVEVPREQIESAIDHMTFLVVLTHVHYRTAEMFDMASLTARAHAVGARVLWDLSHSVGAVPVQLAECRADFAVGCTYKYLNGGPGSPAFLYVREDLQESMRPALSGWMGHAMPFEFVDDYQPGQGMSRHRCGTPSLVAYAALDGALDAVAGLDLRLVRDKSVALMELFIRGIESLPASYELSLASPRDVERRGSHVALTHPRAYDLVQALIRRNVVGDFRAPDVARFGFTPLYLRYSDVWTACETIREVLSNGLDSVQPLRLRGVT